MKKIDATNKKILRILQNEGTITNAELANRVGIAPATTLERVKKLVNSGTINKFVALVDPEKVGKGITAFVAITLNDHSSKAVKLFNKEICEISEVLECYHVAGDADYILKVVTEDIRGYELFAIEKLAHISNVGRITARFVLSKVKHETCIPIE
ncbi:MAG: Lrp/AsnC family transcriptional regulator [Planctomycetota bacterium]|jgi:Lrp/AsnC family leucine-responsive transcriptional regulator